MDDIKDELTDFISTSFDELADNDVPVFKQIKHYTYQVLT